MPIPSRLPRTNQPEPSKTSTPSRHTCAGWEIVCPDGRVRHYPFHNFGDAEAMALRFSERRCQLFKEPSPLELRHPPCPEGKHEVHPMVLDHAAVEHVASC